MAARDRDMETVDTELWSTIDIRLGDPFPTVPLEWFTYGRAQQVTNAVRPATPADTNIARNGDAGLPQDYTMHIRGWRARAIAPRAALRSDAWWEWCAFVCVRFKINQRLVAEWTLDELLRAPNLRTGVDSPGSFRTPIELQAGLAYAVELSPQVGGRKAEAARAAALMARAEYTLVPPEHWDAIKLRCYLRGDLTKPKFI